MLSIKNGYRNIFEYANIPMWEQDISKALPFLSLLKKQGIKDVALFIQKNPEIALLIAKKIKAIDVNKAALKLFEASNKKEFFINRHKIIVNKSISAFQKNVVCLALGKMHIEDEVELWTLKGKKLEVIINLQVILREANKVRMIVSIVDVTQKKILETKLMQSQKLEAVGRLAGGLAHDFNNLLMVIMGYAEMLLEYNNMEHSIKEKLKHIKQCCNKATRLTNKLLSFSRMDNVQYKKIDINIIISELSIMINQLLRKNIKLELNLINLSLYCLIDQNMFEQAIMNLVVNAYDAMPNGGKLIIKTKYIESLYDIKLLSNIIKHHSYAVISVIDNGCGIDSNDIDKLFEPFFTTKNIGKGSGLGLSQVYGTIKRFNGIIDVHSKLNSGASFIIYLPVV